jgi:hypothetical protein
MATATDNTPATETDEDKRRPYVVVLMSEEMKAALQAYAKDHDTNPTALGRKLFATAIGYDLSSEPEPTRRSVYANDADREAAKKMASKKSGLLRKALFQVHMGQLKKRGELLSVANGLVIWLTETQKPDLATLEAKEATLDAAIKAGK